MKVTTQDVAQLLASAPPREVPGHVLRELRRRNGVTALFVFGLILTLFGAGMSNVFLSPKLVDEGRLALGRPASAAGTVTATYPTSLSVNKRRVHALEFRFTVDGRPHQGTSYVTGSSWPAGEAVTVDYLPADPSVARVAGARMTPGGWATLIVLLFPAVGVALLAGVVVTSRRLQRLVVDGRAREVDVLSCEGLGFRSNRRTVYRVRVSHPTDPSAPPVEIATTDRGAVAVFQKRAEQKRPIYALYHPDRPARMVFPETWLEP